MSVDELSGRALDAAVARHVFGLEVGERPNTRTREGSKRQEVYARSHWNEPSGVRVVLEHADGRTVGVFGHPDEALCRAALQAVQEA